nr:hypothetical protein [Candidatus Frankia nodulisporulans]
MVTTSLAQQRPARLVGVPVNMPLVGIGQAAARGELTDLTDAEWAALARLREYTTWGMACASQQSTRPQTVGYGLVDSPVAQCAWIVEKFHEWTGHDGDLTQVLSRDQILDDVSVYWFTGTGASSARLYWESLREVDADEVAVPSGISVFPHEIFRASRRWAERRFTDLRWFGEPARGGHVAAFEQPALFVDEVRGFFRLVR